MVQRVSHDAQHTYGLREREGSAAPQSLCHRLTRHVLHREEELAVGQAVEIVDLSDSREAHPGDERSEEHTSELQSRLHLVCRLLLEKKKRHRLLVIANAVVDKRDPASLDRAYDRA